MEGSSATELGCNDRRLVQRACQPWRSEPITGYPPRLSAFETTPLRLADASADRRRIMVEPLRSVAASGYARAVHAPDHVLLPIDSARRRLSGSRWSNPPQAGRRRTNRPSGCGVRSRFFPAVPLGTGRFPAISAFGTPDASLDSRVASTQRRRTNPARASGSAPHEKREMREC